MDSEVRTRPIITAARKSKPQPRMFGITPGVKSGGYTNWSGSVTCPDTSANTEGGYANWPAIPAIKQKVEKKRKVTIDLIDLVSDDVIFYNC